MPKIDGAGWSFQKFNRRAQDWAIVGVAAWRRNGDSGIGLVNMGPTPVLAKSVSAALAGGASVADAAEAGRRRRRAPGRPERQRRVSGAPGQGARTPRPRGGQQLSDASAAPVRPEPTRAAEMAARPYDAAVSYDAVVVGAGPNGLSAAITLAAAGRSVLVIEAADTVGGGTRSAELTRPGFIHDVCSAVHPLGIGSPFLSSLPLDRHGLRWLQPEVPLAHPLDGGRCGVLQRSVEDTAAGLGADGDAYRRWVGALADRWDELAPMLTGPLVRIPRHPFVLARFGLPALAPAATFAGRVFDTDEGRALFAGCAAHAFLPLDHLLTTSFGFVLLAAGNAVGWPVAAGGSQAIADALAAHLKELGGEIRTGETVTAVSQLPASRAVLFDLVPRLVASVAGDELPERFRSRLLEYRHGPGAFKVDYALSEPVPWTHEAARRAGTVHVGGSAEEVAASEASAAAGHAAERPYVLVAQQSLIDPSRAPAGQHTLWAYCHVPSGSTVDMTERLEAQIERFAPGFRDTVLARHVADPAWFEAHNPNFVGGDIAGGSHGGLQLVFRPTPQLHAYRTPNPRLFLCSASTPPGAGVHGMCGHHAARAALRGVLV